MDISRDITVEAEKLSSFAQFWSKNGKNVLNSIGLVAVWIAAFSLFAVKPRTPQSCLDEMPPATDNLYNQMRHGNTVEFWVVFTPIIFQVLILLFRIYNKHLNRKRAVLFVLYCIAFQLLAYTATNAVKYSTCRLRPDAAYTLARPELKTIYEDSFRSFLSGHSVHAVFNCVIVFYQLSAINEDLQDLWFVLSAPFAVYVPVSRIMDNRHHPIDVVTGSLLGLFMAVFAVRSYLRHAKNL